MDPIYFARPTRWIRRVEQGQQHRQLCLENMFGDMFSHSRCKDGFTVSRSGCYLLGELATENCAFDEPVSARGGKGRCRVPASSTKQEPKASISICPDVETSGCSWLLPGPAAGVPLLMACCPLLAVSLSHTHRRGGLQGPNSSASGPCPPHTLCGK